MMMITCLIGDVVFPSLLFPSLARAGTATSSCDATTAAITCFAVGKYFRQSEERDSIYTTSIQDVSRDTAGGGTVHARNGCSRVVLHRRDRGMNWRTTYVTKPSSH